MTATLGCVSSASTGSNSSSSRGCISCTSSISGGNCVNHLCDGSGMGMPVGRTSRIDCVSGAITSKGSGRSYGVRVSSDNGDRCIDSPSSNIRAINFGCIKCIGGMTIKA